MPVYERVFGIEYPLPKLDTLIVSAFAYTSVPVLINQAEDFDSGAMENWVRRSLQHRRRHLTVCLGLDHRSHERILPRPGAGGH
jgi:hypothetical protein